MNSMSRAILAVSLTIALGLFCGTPALAQLQTKTATSRGELLYATHCSGCHTADIHWRRQKLATNWNSLVTQVRRWQTNIGLLWNDDEIEEVARYLNALHYGFPTPERKGFSQENKPDHARRR